MILIFGLENHIPDVLSRFYDEENGEKTSHEQLVLASVVANELHVKETAEVAGLQPGVYSEALDALEPITMSTYAMT
jgi:hypothetical protein